MAHRKTLRDVMKGLKLWWHGLNDVVSKITLDTNPLGWDVIPVQIAYADTGKLIETEDAKESYEDGEPETFVHHFWRATDDGLPVGKRSFNPKSYADSLNVEHWLNFIRNSLAGMDSPIQTIGSVRNRGRLFCTSDLPAESIKLTGGHKLGTKLCFIRSLDMTCKWHVTVQSHDTVCDNTTELSLAIKSPFTWSLKMTNNAPERIDDMGKLIDKAIGIAGQFNASMKEFANTPLPVEQAKGLFAGFEASEFKQDKRTGLFVIGSTADKLTTNAHNRAERLVELSVNGIGNKGERTLDKAFHAVTEYYGRESSITRGKQAQWESSEHGTGRIRKAEFLGAITNRETRKELIDRGTKLVADFATAN